MENRLTSDASAKLLANYLLHELDRETYPLLSEAMMVALEDMEKLNQIKTILRGDNDG